MSEERRQFAKIAAVLAGARSILVSGHQSPDGDSLGSALALVRMLRAAGKDAWATASAKELGRLSFLEGVKDLIPPRKLARRKFDLFFYVDCAAPERLPPEVRPMAEKLPSVTIDHHATSEPCGLASVIEPRAAAAGEIVWRFAKWMKWTVDRAVADALWVALVTDSGRFAYESTSPETLRVAADLVRHGARTAWINDVVYCSFPMTAIELKRRAWRSLHVWKNRRVAEVTLSADDFAAVGGSKADAEDVIEIPRGVARNEVALFFYAMPGRGREVKVSIRTRDPWDATELAGKFGGGGHVRAAGCTIPGGLAHAKRLMRAAIRALFGTRRA